MVPEVEPVVSPMPVATDLFSPGNGRPSNRLLFVGRLNAQKGTALLLDALAAMRVPAELDVVGDGPDADALKAQAARLGVSGRIRWHGSLPQPRLVDFYRAASALVVPSRDEGFGLVAVEAQLCETPVVAFASGGLADSIEDGVTGYLTPAGDAAALATTLDAVLQSDGRHDVGRAGRQFALARYAPESVARRYRLLYESALRPSPEA
jgi:glycosyltransferase involved in cell wall biosynthesis